MSGEGDDDAFERLLEESLDPGDIRFLDSEKEEILATAGFMDLLARALDPGEIDFDEVRRRELVARLTLGVKEQELTAWALGELEEGRRDSLERRMASDEALKLEVLAIRNFCNRAQVLLPPLPVPGWWERRRLRRMFSEQRSGERILPLAGAAAIGLALFLIQKPMTPASPEQVRSAAGKRLESGPLPAALSEEVRMASPSRGGHSRDLPVSPPAQRAAPDSWPVASLAPVEIPRVFQEAAFGFSVAPQPPLMGVEGSGRQLDLEQLFAFHPADPARSPRWEQAPATREFESDSLVFAGLESDSPILSPRWSAGGRELVAAAVAIARSNGADPDPDGDPDSGAIAGANDPLAMSGPEPGSLLLSQSQPYVLSALLRGPVSGRPDLSGAGEGLWMSADFQSMDLNLPSGKGGLESDSWKIEAGMSWLLSDSWQAGVSVAGIDSRFEVPGFGSVEAEGVALAWSLDWRKDGYHAALTHTFGTFDEDLRRTSGGGLQTAEQDATAQLLALWFSREFEAGGWVHGPVAGLEGSWGSLEGYQESFPGGVGMAGRDFGLMTSLVGWQMAGKYETAAGDWMPHAVVGWRHRAVLADAAMVQGGPAGSYAVAPVLPERDSLLLEGGLRWVPEGGRMAFDAVSSTEWRDGGDSENSVLFKLRLQF